MQKVLEKTRLWNDLKIVCIISFTLLQQKNKTILSKRNEKVKLHCLGKCEGDFRTVLGQKLLEGPINGTTWPG